MVLFAMLFLAPVFLIAGLDERRMPDANTLLNMAERLSGSFGIALLATLYASRAAATGSPVTAFRDCALVLTVATAVGAVVAACNHGMAVTRAGSAGERRRASAPGAAAGTHGMSVNDAG